MSLTKIGSIGINTGIQFAGVTTVSTLHVGSGVTLSSDGDVFATGISTFSEDIKVGSGITLSPDGDVFYTGIATGNGSGLTALNASNISSGTVPTARLGSGTASSSTFLRGDSTFQTVDTDLVSDTSPQLGGNLDVNTKNILFGDSGGATDDRLTFGAGTDLSIYHNGSDSYIEDSGTGALVVKTSQLSIRNAADDEQLAKFIQDSAVELYHNNTKRLETTSGGVSITSKLTLPDGAGNGLRIGDSSDLQAYHDGSASWIYENGTGPLYIGTNNSNIEIMGGGSASDTMAKFKSTEGVELYHNNVKKFETHDVGTIFTEAGSGATQAAIKVNTTLDTYGSVTVRDKRDVDNAVAAFQVENASNGTNETNLLLRSVNLGSTAFSHGLYAAKSHRFGVSSNVTPTVQIDSDGLKFNNDQAAANALDDYEEGTSTPDFANADNSIVTVDHYYYTKIGRLVHFEAKFTVGSNSDGSGFGFSLPVGQAGSRETVIPAISTRSSPNSPFAFVINANQSYAYAKALQGYGTTNVEYQDFAGSVILVSGTYEAA